VPLDPSVAQAGDDGAPTVVSAPESVVAEALGSVMREIEETLVASA